MADAGPLSFDADEPLPPTGEAAGQRIPQDNYWFQRNFAAYRFAASRAAGRRVLDAGCGDGHGTDLLGRNAREVVGVDTEEPAVRRAAARYPRIPFETATLPALPFEDASFGAVVSLQLIEHIRTPQEFLAESRRVLMPGGILVLSTPNRLTFSREGARSPFHTFEFAASELRAAVARHFSSVDLLGTFHGPRLAAADALLRSSLPERLIRQPAPEWPWWLRALVDRVRPSDFAVRPGRPDRSLDLVAVARV